jgi:hypothetical protein
MAASKDMEHLRQITEELWKAETPGRFHTQAWEARALAGRLRSHFDVLLRNSDNWPEDK